MAMVEFTWTMPIPNEFMVDHTFTDGKTVQKVYDGPDKLFLIINNEYKKIYIFFNYLSQGIIMHNNTLFSNTRQPNR